jgi:hypothetical protein
MEALSRPLGFPTVKDSAAAEGAIKEFARNRAKWTETLRS